MRGKGAWKTTPRRKVAAAMAEIMGVLEGRGESRRERDWLNTKAAMMSNVR